MDHNVNEAGQSTGNSPISKLPMNVLWWIFSINTFSNSDFLQPEPLHGQRESSIITARHTSQVCASWRSTMLSAPSIWANTINFEYLGQKRNDWREEVIRRTGESLLSIIAYDLRRNDPRNRFLFWLLETEVGRIRRIAASTPYHGVVASGQGWEILFSKRAPYLEVMNVSQPRRSNESSDVELAPLFCDDAPRLHTLFITGSTPKYLPASWNSNIRYLKLRFTYLDFPFFNAVSAMRSLEFLSLVQNSAEKSVEGKEISLPNLREFHLFGKIQQCTRLMNIFVPNGTQSPIWTSTITMVGYSIVELANLHEREPTLRRAISAHMQGQFRGNMMFSLADEYMIIGNHNHFCAERLTYPEGYFHINIRLCPELVRAIYIDELTKAGGLSTTCVFFDINRAPSESNMMDTAVFNLLRSLPNVHTMHTGMYGLMYLSNWLLGAGKSLAQLRTLIIDSNGTSHIPLRLSLITNIVEQRRDVGFPLNKVDLSGCVNVKKDVASRLRREGVEVVSNDHVD